MSRSRITDPGSIPPRARKRRARWALGGVAIAAAVGVGAPFLYIHLVQGKPAAPLTVDSISPSAPAATAPGASIPTGSAAGATATTPITSLEGSWRIDAGSQAGYRVGEVLFGQSTTAVGRTTAVTGTMTIAGTVVSAAAFSVDMATVKSDQDQRDGQFRGRIMNVSTYPTATFRLTRPIQMDRLPTVGETITQPATGTLTLRGATRAVTFSVSAKRDATDIAVSGSIPITFADFGIANPSFGPASTDDRGTLEFALRLVPA